MTTQRTRPMATGLWWLVLGIVALVVLSGLVAVGAASLRTADRTTTLLAQLQDANAQIDKLRADYSAAQDAQLRLERQNDRLIRVNRQQREQLRALLTYLRQHGIAVPPAPASDEMPPPSLPKAPAAHSGTPPHPKPRPASPSPITSPAPTASPTPTPTPRPVCTLLPPVCR